jgi:hypothetical protein
MSNGASDEAYNDFAFILLTSIYACCRIACTQSVNTHISRVREKMLFIRREGLRKVFIHVEVERSCWF